MTVTLELTPEQETQVQQNAELQGMPVEDYIRQLIAEVPPPRQKSLYETLSPEEFAKVLREWAESHKDWPVLTDEAMSREVIYSHDGGY